MVYSPYTQSSPNKSKLTLNACCLPGCNEPDTVIVPLRVPFNSAKVGMVVSLLSRRCATKAFISKNRRS